MVLHTDLCRNAVIDAKCTCVCILCLRHTTHIFTHPHIHTDTIIDNIPKNRNLLSWQNTSWLRNNIPSTIIPIYLFKNFYCCCQTCIKKKIDCENIKGWPSVWFLRWSSSSAIIAVFINAPLDYSNFRIFECLIKIHK